MTNEQIDKLAPYVVLVCVVVFIILVLTGVIK